MDATDRHAAWQVTAHAGGLSQAMVGIVLPSPHGKLITSGVLLAGLLAGAGWQWFCRNKLFVMKPHEIALQELEAAEYHARRGEEQDYYGQVLNILQRYLEVQLKLFRPGGMDRDTFLHALTEHAGPLTGYQKLLLCDVINHGAKDVSMASHQVEALRQKASHFIWATACYRSAGSGTHPELVGTTGAS
jgi:hypothetical protein